MFDSFYDNISMLLDILAPAQHKVINTRSDSFHNNTKLNVNINKAKSRYKLSNNPIYLIKLSRLLRIKTADVNQRILLEETRALGAPQPQRQLRTLLNRRSKKAQSIPHVMSGPLEAKLTDPKKIASAFAVQFAAAMSIEATPAPKLLATVADCLCSIEVTSERIRSTIDKLSPSTGTGPDDVPANVLKDGGPEVPLILQSIFTRSISSGDYPNRWKVSHILPRHKGGSRSNIINYRPIHHTPIVSRVLEKIVKQDLMQHLLKNNYFNPSQHGFLSKRSCITCQTEFFDMLTAAIDSKLSVIVIYLDMTKAFDTVPHERLMAKLSAAGIGNPLLEWLRSFLTNRTQVVKIDTEISSPRSITSGVIQGSVLGPLLFLIYVNDLCSHIRSGTPFLFADDCKIIFSFEPNNYDVAMRDIQSDLDAIAHWSMTWLMSFSTHKSNALYFNCDTPATPLTLNATMIPICQTVRDLGYVYTNCLQFADHILSRTTKARQTSHLILRHFKSREARVHLYKMYVRPVLEYGSIIHSNLRKAERLQVESIQRNFTRYICYLEGTPTYSERCQILSLEPLWMRRLKLNLTIYYTIVYNRPNSLCLDTPRSSSHAQGPYKNSPYTLRNQHGKVEPLRARTKTRSCFFLIRYTGIWNKLPEHIRTSASVARFRFKLSTFLTLETVAQIFDLQILPDILFREGPPNI